MDLEHKICLSLHFGFDKHEKLEINRELSARDYFGKLIVLIYRCCLRMKAMLLKQEFSPQAKVIDLLLEHLRKEAIPHSIVKCGSWEKKRIDCLQHSECLLIR